MPCTSMLKNHFLVQFGNSLMENLMAPFGFPWMGLFGSIFGGKMGGDNAPDVAAQKRPFGAGNGSTMPLDECPLLCKKWTLIINNRYKMRIEQNPIQKLQKTKNQNKKLIIRTIKPFFKLGTKSVPPSLGLRRKFFYS